MNQSNSQPKKKISLHKPPTKEVKGFPCIPEETQKTPLCALPPRENKDVSLGSKANRTALMIKHSIKVACSNCNLRELCMPIGLTLEELIRVDELVTRRPVIKRGATLFHNGEKFTSLYAIRTGFFKTCVTTEDGRDQVTGFQMAGEIIGLDGIVNDHHTCDAVALEDAEVCVLPFERIEEISREVKALQHHVHKIMSREIVREHGVMLLLGNMRAEERLAAFLLNLVQRLHARGFSQSDLILRMTREEIGSYLGLTLETVSRTFSKFADDGLVAVNQRHIHIHNPEALKGMVNLQECH
jgi:CRP/FNR family transcriptional regulator, anaerobic regulatory protein